MSRWCQHMPVPDTKALHPSPAWQTCWWSGWGCWEPGWSCVHWKPTTCRESWRPGSQRDRSGRAAREETAGKHWISVRNAWKERTRHKNENVSSHSIRLDKGLQNQYGNIFLRSKKRCEGNANHCSALTEAYNSNHLANLFLNNFLDCRRF